MKAEVNSSLPSGRFYHRLEGLRREGFHLMPRFGDGPAAASEWDRAMVFRESDGRLVAVLVDDDGLLWTFSEREGLVCEDPPK